jgi:hypothetical protein
MASNEVVAAVEAVLADKSGRRVVPFPDRPGWILWRRGTKVMLTPVKERSKLSLGKGAEGQSETAP